MVEDYLRERSGDVEQHPMGEAWFKNWSAGTCEFQGLEPGTEEYRQCRREQVDRALSSTVHTQAIKTTHAVASAVRGVRDRW